MQGRPRCCAASMSLSAPPQRLILQGNPAAPLIGPDTTGGSTARDLKKAISFSAVTGTSSAHGRPRERNVIRRRSDLLCLYGEPSTATCYPTVHLILTERPQCHPKLRPCEPVRPRFRGRAGGLGERAPGLPIRSSRSETAPAATDVSCCGVRAW